MSEEIEKAQLAKPGGDTIFGKIVRKEIPCEFIYEDDQVLFVNNLTGDTAPWRNMMHRLFHIQFIEFAYSMKQFSVT